MDTVGNTVGFILLGVVAVLFIVGIVAFGIIAHSVDEAIDELEKRRNSK